MESTEDKFDVHTLYMFHMCGSTLYTISPSGFYFLLLSFFLYSNKGTDLTQYKILSLEHYKLQNIQYTMYNLQHNRNYLKKVLARLDKTQNIIIRTQVNNWRTLKTQLLANLFKLFMWDVNRLTTFCLHPTYIFYLTYICKHSPSTFNVIYNTMKFV